MGGIGGKLALELEHAADADKQLVKRNDQRSGFPGNTFCIQRPAVIQAAARQLMCGMFQRVEFATHYPDSYSQYQRQANDPRPKLAEDNVADDIRTVIFFLPDHDGIGFIRRRNIENALHLVVILQTGITHPHQIARFR